MIGVITLTKDHYDKLNFTPKRYYARITKLNDVYKNKLLFVIMLCDYLDLDDIDMQVAYSELRKRNIMIFKI
jgi:predicted metallo-beta-lactamase superfamily hydrolase